MLAGTDLTQLTSKEMQAVPYDYIRQVCMLPLAATGAEETGAEQSEADKAMLQASYKQWMTKRYL